MNQILTDFWEWANLTPEDYAREGIPLTSEKAPFNYPLYDNLITYASKSQSHRSGTVGFSDHYGFGQRKRGHFG